jgi:hypothetical protein
MRVRLTRKLAEMIDGIDLTGHDVGDVLDLPETKARLLLAEQWAFIERRAGDRAAHPRQFMRRSCDREEPAADASSAAAASSSNSRSIAADRESKPRSRSDQ